MTKVITYGTYDHLHYGHVRLLERAKELGDYLIVGITSGDFDKVRGKINVEQSLVERIKAVEATGLADKIVVEEYEGQKIDDIIKYGVDIFTVGSDWVGHFDYLNEFCKVVYIDRTKGISSSDIREHNNAIKLGLVGNGRFINKVIKEVEFVNAIKLEAICSKNDFAVSGDVKRFDGSEDGYDKLLECVDAVYIRTEPKLHYTQIKKAINAGVHVLCESPIVLEVKEWTELKQLSEEKGVQIVEAIKTAYSTAYARLLLLLKAGVIGDVVCVDATCTSLISDDLIDEFKSGQELDNIYEWIPTVLLPVFQILGDKYNSKKMVVKYLDEDKKHDGFVKIDFIYDKAVASVKAGNSVKSEGELVISGTKGYVYVPAPWWKTEYFELRYENSADNKRYFYQLDGEGIRYELVAFANAIASGSNRRYISNSASEGIIRIMEDYINNVDVYTI